MAKYIDAERLKAEVTKERKSIVGLFIEGDNSFYDGQDDAYNHVLALIDSFQQEQPEVDLEKEIERWMDLNSDSNGFYNVVDYARHFFELGQNSK